MDVLKQWLEQIEVSPAPNVTRYFCVTTHGGGRYKVDEVQYRVGTEPPAVYEFASDNGDSIVIWSTNPFLKRERAHDIAVEIGDRIGCYV